MSKKSQLVPVRCIVVSTKPTVAQLGYLYMHAGTHGRHFLGRRRYDALAKETSFPWLASSSLIYGPPLALILVIIVFFPVECPGCNYVIDVAPNHI